MERKECLPYTNDEFPNAMDRLLSSPSLPSMARFLFPNAPFPEFCQFLKNIRTTEIFQRDIISPAIATMLKKTSGGITISGLENCDKEKQYLFISNHRDIICDSALFTDRLLSHGYKTPKICLGDNLLTDSLIIDLVKMNKGITVKRNLPPRELLKWSYILSDLIYEQITTYADSVWIAQREGRAKDGNDLTHPGVIKMLTLGTEQPLEERLELLHIIPVAISYEFDPCDVFKARELFLISTQGAYHKEPGEDTMSMIAGIQGNKGRIHIAVGKELDILSLTQPAGPSKKDQIHAVAQAIDQQIHQNYLNRSSNYVAYDLFDHSNKMSAYYTPQDKDKFLQRLDSQLELLKMNPQDLIEIKMLTLKAYANSVQDL